METKTIKANGNLYIIKYQQNGNIILDVINQLNDSIEESTEKNKGILAKYRDVDFSTKQINVRETLLEDILSFLWNVKDNNARLLQLEGNVESFLKILPNKISVHFFPVISSPQSPYEEQIAKSIQDAKTTFLNLFNHNLFKELDLINFIRAIFMATVCGKILALIKTAIKSSINIHCETLYSKDKPNVEAWGKITCHKLTKNMSFAEAKKKLSAGDAGTDRHLELFTLKKAIKAFRADIKLHNVAEKFLWPFTTIDSTKVRFDLPSTTSSSSNSSIVSSSRTSINTFTIDDFKNLRIQDKEDLKMESLGDTGYVATYTRSQDNLILKVLEKLIFSIQQLKSNTSSTDSSFNAELNNKQLKVQEKILADFLQYLALINDIPARIIVFEEYFFSNLNSAILFHIENYFKPQASSTLLDSIIALTSEVVKIDLCKLIQDKVNSIFFQVDRFLYKMPEHKAILSNQIIKTICNDLYHMVSSAIENSIQIQLQSFNADNEYDCNRMQTSSSSEYPSPIPATRYKAVLENGSAGTAPHRTLIEVRNQLHSFLVQLENQDNHVHRGIFGNMMVRKASDKTLDLEITTTLKC